MEPAGRGLSASARLVLLLVARLLGPGPFGRLALALVFIELGRLLADAGLSLTAIRRFARTDLNHGLLLGRLLDGRKPVIMGEYAEDPRVRVEFNEINSGSTFRQWNRGGFQPCHHTGFFEHVLRLAKAFAGIARTLKPDGALIYTVPYDLGKTVDRADLME